MKNYYKILGIEPTTDLDKIKKAYKKKAIEMHPDKTLSGREVSAQETEDANSKFREVQEAWESLRANPVQIYNQLLAELASDELGDDLEATQPAPPPTDIVFGVERESSPITVKGVKVTVFVPLSVSSVMSDTFWRLSPQRSIVDINHVMSATIDREWIAACLTNNSTEYARQVGVDLDEVLEIYRQHSYHKGTTACGVFGIKVEVDHVNVNFRQPEYQTEGMQHFRAGEGEAFFSLKRGTKIEAQNIKSVEFSRMEDRPKRIFEREGLQLGAFKLPELTRSASSWVTDFSRMINDSDYWKETTPLKNHIPRGILEMRTVVSHDYPEITGRKYKDMEIFTRLKDVAHEHLALRKGGVKRFVDAMNSRSKTLLSLYEAVDNARTPEEISAWVSSTYNIDKAAQTRRIGN